jgi:hypothetical protein
MPLEPPTAVAPLPAAPPAVPPDAGAPPALTPPAAASGPGGVLASGFAPFTPLPEVSNTEKSAVHATQRAPTIATRQSNAALVKSVPGDARR